MFGKLLQHFEAKNMLRIEVQEVADFLVANGSQDRIILRPEPMNPGELVGVYYQYTTHAAPYAQPDFVTLIVYPSNAPLEMQRLVCCKELIHVCDGKVARTDTLEEVDALCEKLLGPMTSDDYGIADIMASVDRFALYQGLALLFPWAARETALALIAQDKATESDVAEWACLPLGLAKFVLSDEWAEAYELIKQL